MSIQKVYTLCLTVLLSSLLFAQDNESFDLSENEGNTEKAAYKTFSDCFKSKELHLKKSSDSYMIQIPYDGKHVISITDNYGKVLSSFTTSDREEWYDIERTLPSGTYVIKVKTPEMKLYKFVIVI